MTIMITQWKCPSGHCSIAMLWDDSEQDAANVLIDGEELYSNGSFNRWCGICGSLELKPDTGKTGFRTMETAKRSLVAVEQANALARHFLGRF